MHKVLVADDHVQVLDFLSQMIPWGDLQLELMAVCADGCEALEKSQEQLPDILITDIGMPNMNGLDLIEELRARKPGIKTVILSCHEDFPYAQRAVKLRVNEYVLKESLRPEQLILILRQLVELLTQEEIVQQSQSKLQIDMERSFSTMKSNFIVSLIEQPVMDEADWLDKATVFGIHLDKGTAYMPVICAIDRYMLLETTRFRSGHTLSNVLDNALNELLESTGTLFFQIDPKQFLLLFPFPSTIKVNGFEEMRIQLHHIQTSLMRFLKISSSFFFEKPCTTIVELKKQIQMLLNMKDLRFYTEEGTISKVHTFSTSSQDLFAHYSEALHDFRHVIMLEDELKAESVRKKWVAYIRSSMYPADAVRSWFLKIIMDLELKFTVMHNFVTNYNTEALYASLYELDTLSHLDDWFQQFLINKMLFFRKIRGATVINRREIAEAQRYVKTHLSEKISMEEMAARLQMNSTHFSRIFKKETGETFIEFVNKQKLEHAVELLENSNLCVEQIAGMLGYEHTSYFIKLFRAFSGMSPLEFRKQL
ncbi:helix-turn-helix domain-containing protein [Paenibacillus periandrae]|uniref:helix-turn-helix domain-containing protein n=1 Tax=Paenibacillus periandrae TaxID=1761741 RepID=UPI001F08D6EC|nr:helix-turn-helix domain-containing protein [Paenibacillus periandrae]